MHFYSYKSSIYSLKVHFSFIKVITYFYALTALYNTTLLRKGVIIIKHKKYLLLFIPVIILITFIISPKRIIVSNSSSPPLKYNFGISNIDKLDKLLSNQRFNYSTDINKKYISIILLENNTAYVEEHIVTDGGATDITIPQNTNFIISLDANSTIAYTWNIKNNFNTDTIDFIKKTNIFVPMPLFKPKTDGDGYDRENLYLKSLNKGNDKLVLRYEHKEGQNTQFFESTLNINIK